MKTGIKQFIFKLGRAISILSSKPLILVDKFSYLGSNILSTESDLSIVQGKVWSAIDRLVIKQKSDFSGWIKWDFFQAMAVSILLYGCTTWMLTNHFEKKLDRNKTLNMCSFEQIQKATPHKILTVCLPTSHLTNHPSKTNKTCRALLKKKGQS